MFFCTPQCQNCRSIQNWNNNWSSPQTQYRPIYSGSLQYFLCQCYHYVCLLMFWYWWIVFNVQFWKSWILLHGVDQTQVPRTKYCIKCQVPIPSTALSTKYQVLHWVPSTNSKYCIEHSFVCNFFWGQPNGAHPPLVLVNILSWPPAFKQDWNTKPQNYNVCTRAWSFGQERNKCEHERSPHPSSFKTEMPWIEDQFVQEVILAILPFSQLHNVSGLPFSCSIRRRRSST